VNLETQFESRTASPVSSWIPGLTEERNPAMRSPGSRLAQLGSLGCLLLLFVPLNGRGEERARYEDAAAHGPMPVLSSPVVGTSSLRSWLASERFTESVRQTASLCYSQLATVLQTRVDSAAFGPEVSLLRFRVPSHYATPSYAGISGSYGQFFDDDTIGRSRISGVGLRDKDWFYLKVSFAF
jgi:hypothetical protein